MLPKNNSEVNDSVLLVVGVGNWKAGIQFGWEQANADFYVESQSEL
jgi:hypothetical protein